MSMRNLNCDLVAQFPQSAKIGSICRRQPPRYTCLSKEHRLWRQINQLEIQQLAKLIGCYPEQIDGFLYKLSLENYNHLLNPKGCGWDSCKVPLCYPCVCDRYMAIFDHRGNLRSSIRPKSLNSLLSLILDYLNEDSPGGRKDYQSYPFGHQAKPHSRTHSMRDDASSPGSVYSDNRSLRSLNWQYNVSQRVENSITPLESESMLWKLPELESQEDLRKEKKKKTFGRQSVFLNDELALAYAKPDDYVEYLLKTLGRHRIRGSYVGPVGHLRTLRVRLLLRKLVEQKGTNISEEDLRKALKKVDLEWKKTARADYKRERKTAEEISMLYNAIVQRSSEHPIPPVLGKVRGNYPKVPKPAKLPRRYLGNQVPILFHEPFDSKKPWTWQRRHPRQTRLNSKYKFSTSGIKRYLRSSIRDQIDEASDRYSIHSTISDKSRSGGRESLEPLFGGPKA
ncbi:uncharacterized protein LOC108033663 [Drosophila biarmipes]|uniref:uncharacterized protein LOC108033663 n=1 Tax=Drosophila biarmipes TaxID=125945 RepID=UPI0007E6495E|nr:uncharacterized protein LOC108033663 [Drosophila biarmipes]